MTAHGAGLLARFVRGAALPLLLAILFCHPRPSAVFQAQQQELGGQDTWLGEGVQLAPGQQVDLAWAAPGLSLSGRTVDLAAWEVPASPGPGLEPEASWITKRDTVTRVLQTLVTGSIQLAQTPKPPEGTPADYRLEGRLLAFGRQARVGAKTGQILGNVALVTVNLLLSVVSGGGGGGPGVFIQGVSGYRTEALFQVKITDLRTHATVLAIQSRKDFKSLEAPLELAAAVWRLSGGEAAARNWWPEQPLSGADGDRVWFRPGLDLRAVRIRCLPWLPRYQLKAKVREKDLGENRPARMPGLLAAEPPDGLPGPILSEAAGDLFLQGQCDEPWKGGRSVLTCRVKLWDPATGEVVGLMEVSRGFRLWGQGRSIEAGWVKRIVGHLKAQHPDGSPVAAPNGFWRSTIELGWLEKVLPGPKPPDPGN